MAINKKGVFETLAHKISNIDSNTSTSVIIDTLKAIEKADHNTIVSYDSDGVLPTASATNYRLAYVINNGNLRFNNGLQWDKLQTQLPQFRPPAPPFGGTVAGYRAGGQQPAPSTVIDKYSFVSDGNASDVGDLVGGARYGNQGVQSSVAGYTMGGRTPNAQPSTNSTKITFASDAIASSVTMSIGRQQMATNGVSTETHGYGVAGAGGTEVIGKTIDKFAFATEDNLTDVGDLYHMPADHPSVHTDKNGGYGYVAGGANDYPSPSITTTGLTLIQKFSTTSDGNAVDAVTELDFQRYRTGSNPSPTHGYVIGGTRITPPTVTYSNDMVKYSFTSTNTATDVGDLSQGLIRVGSASSTASGYLHGGQAPSPVNVIQKFPFAADANSTDVGDLTTNSGAHAGVHQ